MKQKRSELEQKALKSLKKAGIDSCRGERGIASIRKTDYPRIKNRNKFFKFVRRNKAYDLLQNRIAARAYADRREEGEVIPGVEVFTKISVSIRKATKR